MSRETRSLDGWERPAGPALGRAGRRRLRRAVRRHGRPRYGVVFLKGLVAGLGIGLGIAAGIVVGLGVGLSL